MDSGRPIADSSSSDEDSGDDSGSGNARLRAMTVTQRYVRPLSDDEAEEVMPSGSGRARATLRRWQLARAPSPPPPRRLHVDSEEEDLIPASDSESDTGLDLRLAAANVVRHIWRGDRESDYRDNPLLRQGNLANRNPDKSLVSELDQSDFSQLTRASLNMPWTELNKGKSEVMPYLIPSRSITRQLAQREIGSCLPYGHFSHAQQCQALSSYLPNKGQKVGQFPEKIFCGRYSRCGDQFMSACQDNILRIHDTSGGKFKLLKEIRARYVGWSVLDVAMSPDNRHLIYSSWCDSIQQVNVFGEDEGHLELPLQSDAGRFCIFSLKFSQDGEEILCGANDGCIYIFNRDRQMQLSRINAHADDVNAVAFLDETTHIVASASDDNLCKVWDRRALHESAPYPVGVLAGHAAGLTFIDSRGDGRHLITNSKDQTIKLWDLRRFSNQKDIDQMTEKFINRRWDYRWENVPSYLNHVKSSKASLKRFKGDTSLMTYHGHTVRQTLIRCRFSPQFSTGQRYIYTGSNTGDIFVYDALTGEIVRRLQGHKQCVRDVSWHPYHPEIMSTSWDEKVVKWTYSDFLEEKERSRN